MSAQNRLKNRLKSLTPHPEYKSIQLETLMLRELKNLINWQVQVIKVNYRLAKD